MKMNLNIFLMSCVALSVACENKSREVQTLNEEKISTRQFTPPPGVVRSMPPHDVRDEGVGPYKIGMPLQEALSSLEGGPRIELWRAEGLSEYRLVRAENGAVVLGADRSGTTKFISLLDPSIIETPEGDVLGAKIGDLKKSLESEESKRFVADPEWVTLKALPALKLFVNNGVVMAALHIGATPGAEVEERKCADHIDSESIEKQIGKLLGARKVELLEQGCLGKKPIWVASLKDQVAIFSIEGAKVKKSVNSYIPGLKRAGLIDVDNDGKDEICFIKTKTKKDEKSIDVAIAKYENRALQTFIRRKLVTLDQSSLNLLGVDLAQSRLLAEVGFKGKELVARTVLVHMNKREVRDIIPVAETKLKVKK